ncbi:hypothetical protein BG005_001952, partial [Podila minutissima]
MSSARRHLPSDSVGYGGVLIMSPDKARLRAKRNDFGNTVRTVRETVVLLSTGKVVLYHLILDDDTGQPYVNDDAVTVKAEVLRYFTDVCMPLATVSHFKITRSGPTPTRSVLTILP